MDPSSRSASATWAVSASVCIAGMSGWLSARGSDRAAVRASRPSTAASAAVMTRRTESRLVLVIAGREPDGLEHVEASCRVPESHRLAEPGLDAITVRHVVHLSFWFTSRQALLPF